MRLCGYDGDGRQKHDLSTLQGNDTFHKFEFVDFGVSEVLDLLPRYKSAPSLTRLYRPTTLSKLMSEVKTNASSVCMHGSSCLAMSSALFELQKLPQVGWKCPRWLTTYRYSLMSSHELRKKLVPLSFHVLWPDLRLSPTADGFDGHSDTAGSLKERIQQG